MAGLLSLLLLQAGAGKLFPDFDQPFIFVLLFVIIGVLIAYAIISREK